MCTCLVLSGPGFALAASDTRHVIGGVTYSLPGRTRRIPNGWLSFSGDAAVGLRAARELEVSGVAGAEGAIDTAVRECAFQRAPNSPTRFMMASDSGELIEVRTDQPVWREPPPGAGFRYSYQPPPGLPDNGKAAFSTMTAACGSAGSVEGIIRAVASLIHDGHEGGGRQSAECEIGFTAGGHTRYCHQPAGVLARATDGAVGRVFSPPPTLPPFPRMESERLIFSLPIEV